MIRACVVVAVFLSGAAVMSLEMAGFALVYPDLGSDIIVWGSLISVFLGGLAIGAWAGGRIADIRPALWKLGVILGAGGVVALTIPCYSDAVFNWTLPDTAPQPSLLTYSPSGKASVHQPKSDLRWPALAAGALLFGLPTILLGMATPYAIRLLVDQMPKLGAGVGRISSISTMGAIVGTLGTAFYLLDWIGSTRWIIRLDGAVLIALGAGLIVAGLLAPREKS